MHGIIFAELKNYVDAKLGVEAWSELLVSAGLGPRMYLAIQSYPDDEVVKIVTAASEKTNLAPGSILEDFGEFIAPHLLAMYRSLVKPEWKSLEVLEHTEETIHKVVRMQHADATPPYLRAKRTGSQQVTITYTSPRRLCHVAKGIIRGIAAHYGDVVTIAEPRCMHQGAGDCLLVVTRSAA